MNFDHILLPHSIGDETEQIIVDARQKIKDYIDYRVSRLDQLLSCFTTEKSSKTRAELYEVLYGSRNLDDMLRMAAFNNLDLQIAKLIKDRVIDEVDKMTYRLI